MSIRERRRITVQGIVQGVGFRPFVYGLARRHHLVGYVHNDATGVMIEAEGDAANLEDFLRLVRDESPPLARIECVAWEVIALHDDTTFTIEASHSGSQRQTFIAPDVCICDDCWRELFDPADRRFRYPFINCTNCGPRFTIIQDVPYDRPWTTMAPFPLCAECQREYDDPANRRFHAQPNACPCCGPNVSNHPAAEEEAAQGYAAIERTAQQLNSGAIVAIKGIGGYHLACDAFNETVVHQLRSRKQRWDKPFALMVPDVAGARRLCEISDLEAELLTSRRRPIVLLRQRQPNGLASQIAPGDNYMGLMLPYTPLHYLLLDACQRQQPAGRGAVLVMTSGNLSDEPITYQDVEAHCRLTPLADAFLTHNRAIYMRCDDAVTRVLDGQALVLRRSRGYAPEPMRAPQEFQVPLLATGAHLKNTFCLGKGHYAFVSHHIGDLENYETLQSFTSGIEHFKRLFDVEPRLVAHDLHPEYLATKYALGLAETQGLTAIGIQHHHAHIAAVTGEHGMAERVIGVTFDGTGYGTDGTLWGGEFMVADWAGFERVASLDTLPLIGGAQSIHQVWRLAAAWLYQVYGDAFLNLDIPFVRQLDRQQWRVMRQMVAQQLNAPLSSAMGRRFDAVAALIGLRSIANYEAQAALELEMSADETCREVYPFELTATPSCVLKMDETLCALMRDLQSGVATSLMAAKFHNTVAAATAEVCDLVRQHWGLAKVALGGGVFQNALLLERTLAALRERDFQVFIPIQLPFNDGGLAFGQAVIANANMPA